MTSVEGGDVRIRRAATSDLREMAVVHRASYSAGHFLALLPADVLAAYYEPFLNGGSQGLVAERRAGTADRYELAGFAVFGADIEPRIQQFKQDQRFAILRTALLHPGVSARKVAQRLIGTAEQPLPHDPAPWLLLSIAVRGPGRGTGGALLREMLRIATDAKQSRFGLYVRHTNVGAINAYLRAGFRISATIADQYYMESSLSQASTTGAT